MEGRSGIHVELHGGGFAQAVETGGELVAGVARHQIDLRIIAAAGEVRSAGEIGRPQLQLVHLALVQLERDHQLGVAEPVLAGVLRLFFHHPLVVEGGKRQRQPVPLILVALGPNRLFDGPLLVPAHGGHGGAVPDQGNPADLALLHLEELFALTGPVGLAAVLVEQQDDGQEQGAEDDQDERALELHRFLLRMTRTTTPITRGISGSSTTEK